MRRLFLVLGLAAPAGMALLPTPPAAARRVQVCDTNASRTSAALGYYRQVAKATAGVRLGERNTLLIPLITDTTLVTLVTNDSLCALAAVTINRDRAVDDTVSRLLILIHMDTVYAVEDSALMNRPDAPSVSYILNLGLDSVVSSMITP